MSLDPSATHIFCQRCAYAHSKTDTVESAFYISTTTVKKADYSSPALISALTPPEEITFCPRCHSRNLDRSMGDATSFLEPKDKRVDPDGLDSERPGAGDADVVFGED